MPRLSDAERPVIVGVVGEQVAGRVPLVVHIGAESARVAIERAREAQSLGAAALMLPPPSFDATDSAMRLRFFREVAESTSAVLVLQDVPFARLDVTLASTLAEEYPGRICMKIETPPTPMAVGEAVRLIANESVPVFGGAGGLCFHSELLRGAAGTMPGASIADLLVGVWRTYLSGDGSRARQLFGRLLPLLSVMMLEGYVMAMHREVLRLRGVLPTSHTRTPSVQASPIDIEELRSLMRDLALSPADAYRSSRGERTMPTSRISAIETVLHEDYPHVVHVLVHTDDGYVGLGESFHHPHAIAEYIHSVIAPSLIGAPATNIANAWRLMGNFSDGYQPFSGTITVDASATSAIDIALWDLRAKILDLPLHEALGGAVRDRVRVYNTCAEAGHLPPHGTPTHRRHEHDDWGIGGPRSTQYDDWQATLDRPGELARELVDSGITAMKIYPFGRYIRETRGLYITPRQLDEGLDIFRAIRASVGNQIDIAVDMSFSWAYAPALKIASALDEFGLIWIEDLTRTSSVQALARIANVIRTPLAGFDYRVGLPAAIDLVEAGAVSIVRMDLQWVGGPSEAIRIAGYAEGRGLGVVLHDCTGPVQWAAAIHCSLRIPNAMIQESVRAYYKLVYPTMVKRVPKIIDGHALALDGLGHGAELLDEYVAGGTTKRSTVINDQFVTAVVDR